MRPRLRLLPRDTWLLFATRFVRLFAYGALSVVLVLYLVSVGLSEQQTGLLLTLTLVGDTLIPLAITTRADRLGRRRMLIAGALLMTGAGLVFASSANPWVLLLAGTIGVVSPSGQEVGPFLPIEQAALAHVVTDRTRTEVFAWYTLTGSVATALGALSAGLATRFLQEAAVSRSTATAWSSSATRRWAWSWRRSSPGCRTRPRRPTGPAAKPAAATPLACPDSTGRGRR